jgi:hypothetical protein
MFEAHRRLLPSGFVIDSLADALQITGTVTASIAEAAFIASRDPSAIPAFKSAFSQFHELCKTDLGRR